MSESDNSNVTVQDNNKPRGFARMDREKQREIASKGGRMAHQKHTAHEFSSAEARRAGHLGGVAVSRDRAHMAAIGRQGGKARRQPAASQTVAAPEHAQS